MYYALENLFTEFERGIDEWTLVQAGLDSTFGFIKEKLQDCYDSLNREEMEDNIERLRACFELTAKIEGLYDAGTVQHKIENPLMSFSWTSDEANLMLGSLLRLHQDVIMHGQELLNAGETELSLRSYDILQLTSTLARKVQMYLSIPKTQQVKQAEPVLEQMKEKIAKAKSFDIFSELPIEDVDGEEIEAI